MSRATKDLSSTPRRLLSYEQVAHYLSVGRSRVYLLVEAGEIPKVKIGARVLFDVADVDAFVERAKRSS